MAQKANLKTVRNLKDDTIIVLNDNNLKKKFDELDSQRYLISLFFRKNVLITNLTLVSVNNRLFLNLTIFFCSSIVAFLKKKNRTKNYALDSKKKTNSERSFLKIFREEFCTNNLLLNIKVLNYKISKEIAKQIYLKTKRYTSLLFSRRYQLFYDIVKISTLFSKKQVPSKVLLKLLVQTFKVLPKKRHGIFMRFLQNLFATLTQGPCTKKIGTNLKGIKFLINGKISGKTRSSSKLILLGSIPTQTISKDISFSFSQANTIYGIFGFKL